METLANLPFVRLAADRTGALAAGTGFVLPPDITDLVVISHGWKNDEADAHQLYATLLDNVQKAAGPAFAANGRRWAVAGVFWPAFRYRPDMTLLPDDGTAGQGGDGAVVGGAAALRESDLPREDLAAYAATIGTMLGEDGVAFARAALDGAKGGGAANAFLDRLRASLTADETLKEDHRSLFDEPGSELVQAMAGGTGGSPLQFHGAESDAEIGGAASFKDVVQRFQQWRTGGRAGVATILNQATYFEMKARAGKVGQALASLIERAAATTPNLRVHLIGHSFGARLVTSLANSLPSLKPASLTLLQAAFSHNGFGSKDRKRKGAAGIDGAFRRVIVDRRITGPIVATHTRRDSAVGFYYPVASALSGVVAAGFASIAEHLIGGPDDPHGGVGANGVLSLLDGEGDEYVAVLDGGQVLLAPSGGSAAPPVFAPGRVHNVLADAVVSEHNDVANPEVGALVWAAII